MREYNLPYLQSAFTHNPGPMVFMIYELSVLNLFKFEKCTL